MATIAIDIESSTFSTKIETCSDFPEESVKLFVLSQGFQKCII